MDSRPAQAIIFRGINGNEAEGFVQAIRQAAFAENKDDDYPWMARFATTCLQGKAMRWHAKLDSNIQMDWRLLVQAILDEWQLEDGRSDVVNVDPT